jgi:hypothetical protein
MDAFLPAVCEATASARSACGCAKLFGHTCGSGNTNNHIEKLNMSLLFPSSFDCEHRRIKKEPSIDTDYVAEYRS